MMRKAYSFSASGACRTTSIGIDARCIFFDDRLPISELEFFDELEAALKVSDTLPDCVVVIASPEALQSFHRYWSDSSEQRESFVSRGARDGVQYVKNYCFFAWSPTGLSLLHNHKTGESDQPLFDVPVEAFVRQGLHALIRDNPVVQIAPAGHVFKHPSGTVNKVFIQARELATSEPQLSFVGRAICLSMKPTVMDDAAVVFVDTMSIHSYVREALAFSGSKARIHSFHSYGELSELSPPSEPYLVVVSASTTGGMARRLHKEQGFDGDRLLTMIDMTAKGRSGSILIALDAVDDVYKIHATDGNETEIELVGEHFSSKAKPPRTVTLGQPHTPRDLTKVLREFGVGGMAAINHMPSGSVSPKVVCLEAGRVSESTKFQEWLSTEIQWGLSVAVDHIVCTDDPGSRDIAANAAAIIQGAKGSPAPPAVIAYGDLNANSLAEAKGVLVVTAIAGDGGLLREISRDLREFVHPTLPRHFLAAVGLPQTEEAWDRLRQFLERNTTPRRYGFSSWLVVPIGADGTSNAWKDLSDLASRAQVQCPRADSVDASVAEAALQALATTVQDAYNGFLSKSDGDPLGLSDGFLFFGDVFKDRLHEVPPSAAYLAVTSALQAARDLKTASNQLKPTGYESVVLAPENFLRFNDNLLQACLLRAAHPSELDYSASPHLSTLIKEFLLKVFARHEHSYGAASLEFAAALATGRLKLKKDDVQDLVATAIARLRSTPSPLLGLLLMVE